MMAICMNFEDGLDFSEEDEERLREARKIEQKLREEQHQYVSITLEQYTDWMLKAHTITQIQKLYDEIDDYECFTKAVGALIKEKGDA